MQLNSIVIVEKVAKAHREGFALVNYHLLCEQGFGEEQMLVHRERQCKCTIHCPIALADVHSDKFECALNLELAEMDGNINPSLTSLNFIMTLDYQMMAAANCGLKDPE